MSYFGKTIRISEDNKSVFAARISEIDVFLVDCDGVIWTGSSGVPFVKEAYEFLISEGKKVIFVTNSTVKTRRDCVSKLSGFGIKASEEQIMSASYATALYLKEIGVTKSVYALGSAGLLDEIESVTGAKVLGAEDFAVEYKPGQLNAADLNPDIEAVVVGFDPACSYTKLATASVYARYRPIPFIVTNPDTADPDNHALIPACGALAACVEIGAGKPADVVVGKPNKIMLDLVAGLVGHNDKSRWAMIGDRLDTDMLFGTNGGLGTTILVMTGFSKEHMVAEMDDLNPQKPTFIIDSFGHIHRLAQSD